MAEAQLEEHHDLEQLLAIVGMRIEQREKEIEQNRMQYHQPTHHGKIQVSSSRCAPLSKNAVSALQISFKLLSFYLEKIPEEISSQ